MLRSTKQMEGHALQARDGQIGEIVDFYFDDHAWQVRYFVVETESSMDGRDVLISPHVVGAMDPTLNSFPVDLTMEQVRNSPSIDTDKPVSRQHEALLQQYYGWPAYWLPLSGAGEFAVPFYFPPPPAAGSEPGAAPAKSAGDPHLRSANDTVGYHIEATDGGVGHVEDFLIDEAGWAIRYLAVDTRNWWPGRKVIVAPTWIRDVSWETRRVHVDLTRSAVKAGPPYEGTASWTPAYAAELHDHYQKPRYPDWEKPTAAGTTKSPPDRV